MRKFIVIIMTLVSVSLYGQEQVHVGDILCTDNTVISHDAFASSGRTALGIVFFVDNTQQHGCAVAAGGSEKHKEKGKYNKKNSSIS